MILEMQKRFINRNYILGEIIGNMVTHYVFHEENSRNYPMNTEISLNWCRGFYHNVYEPNEKYITEDRFNAIAAQCLAGHNMAAKGIIPSMTLKEFMEEMKKPVEHLPNEETCGATPAGYIPPITSPDWPVEIKDYFDAVEPPIDIDSNTNHSRYGGMKKAIGVALTEEDYDMTYDGTDGSQSITETVKKDEVPKVEEIAMPHIVNDSDTIALVTYGDKGYGSNHIELPGNNISELPKTSSPFNMPFNP